MGHQIVKCSGCSKDIKKFDAEIKRSKTTYFFCSYSCKDDFYKRKNTILCDYCKSPHKKKPYLIRKSKNNYCSIQCKSLAGHTMIKCSYCGQDFKRINALINHVRNNFCNTSCMGKWQSENQTGEKSPSWQGKEIIIPCDNCGESLKRPYWQKESNKHNFCNHKCFGEWKSNNWSGENNPSWKGGHTLYYGGNWKRQAKRARKRDSYNCRACGVSEKTLDQALDVHHIIRFFDFDDYRKANMLSNLISLCHSCHMKIEYGKLPLPN